MSVKTRECWFQFQACIGDAAEKTDYVHDALIALRNKIHNSQLQGDSFFTDKNMEDYIGSSVVEDITILPPHQSNTKGCRKRIVSRAEKNVCGIKRQKRIYKTCFQPAFHDSRNCPSKK